MTTLAVPELSLVVLIGTTGSGKSTFARRHFAATEVISSDVCRGLVADDENDQSATPDAFDVLHYIAGKRLAAGRLTVVDATNVQSEARRQLLRLAREHDVLPVAVVLDIPERLCAERNAARPDRADMPAHVLPRQRRELRRSLRGLEREGFRRVHTLRGPEQVEAATVSRERLFNDLRHLTGPFDLIGDIHGCRAELETLLADRLGYVIERDAAGRAAGARHPAGRTAVFVGDLVDRGPDSPGVLRLVMGMAEAGTALVVAGNHENKLGRHLAGRKVRIGHGLAETIEQLAREDEAFVARTRAFLDSLISHYVLDGGRLVVAHAGLPEKYHGRTSGRVRSHAMYGDTTGETDEFGLPVRYPWAEEYRGRAAVVYGHTPVPRAAWINNTLCLDTGCVFGGELTALRWPERELRAEGGLSPDLAGPRAQGGLRAEARLLRQRAPGEQVVLVTSRTPRGDVFRGKFVVVEGEEDLERPLYSGAAAEVIKRQDAQSVDRRRDLKDRLPRRQECQQTGRSGGPCRPRSSGSAPCRACCPPPRMYRPRDGGPPKGGFNKNPPPRQPGRGGGGGGWG
jgi:protein phosphatase